MKNFKLNQKRFVYSSCLMVALVGLTSFNPFSQNAHLALQNKDESLELASNPPERIEVPRADSRGTRVGGKDVARLGNTERQNHGTFSEGYQLDSNETDYSRKDNTGLGNVIGADTSDRSFVYLTRITKRGSSYQLHFKIDASDEARNKTKTEAGICKDAATCSAYADLLDGERVITADKNFDIQALLDGDQSAEKRVIDQITREYAAITRPYKNETKVAGRPGPHDEEMEMADMCEEGDTTAQYKCLKNLKKKVCTRRQERREDANCISKEEYAEALQSVIENVTLDPDISNREFNKFARLASKDRDSAQLMRLATEYRKFMNTNEGFSRNIDRTLNQVNKLDDQIAYLSQYPWMRFEQQLVTNQRQSLVMQMEKEVEGYKNHYQRSALGSAVNTRGQYSEFTQSLRSELELTYSEVVSPISNMFFDQSLASLDRSVYGSSGTGSNQYRNLPLGQGVASSSIDTGTGSNLQRCYNENDPKCSNGYLRTNNSRDSFLANNGINNNQYNHMDPNMSNQQFRNPPFGGQQRYQTNQQYQTAPRLGASI